MHKLFLLLSSLLGVLSVGIGAFGAHGLRKILEANGRQETFETAVKYQFYHTLALFLLGLLLQHSTHKSLEWAGWSFLAGIFIFSGSLYLLCLTGVTKWGAVTPIGGLFLLAGWALMAWGVYKS
jgi:uncharacterized membrane protein YgdD (TMEM256/DUF423 family)